MRINPSTGEKILISSVSWCGEDHGWPRAWAGRVGPNAPSFAFTMMRGASEKLSVKESLSRRRAEAYFFRPSAKREQSSASTRNLEKAIHFAAGRRDPLPTFPTEHPVFIQSEGLVSVYLSARNSLLPQSDDGNAGDRPLRAMTFATLGALFHENRLGVGPPELTRNGPM